VQFGSLELADRVGCYSDFGAAMLRTTKPVVMIKGGVDARLFTPPAVRPPRDRVLYVGRLLPHKGIDQLIEALPPDLPLTCCGRPYHADYFARLRHLAAGKQVEFVTDASDAVIREMYSRAWANVLPSVYQDCYGQRYVAPELMGLTLLEGMACGTPVICSRVGAMPEFVRHGETGFVFDTPAELTAQLRTLAGDPPLAERMGFHARRAVETEFDLRVCGAKLVDVYRGLIEGGGAAARGVAA
jgi:glycosyltransferase involved in cell wall biosynthesis